MSTTTPASNATHMAWNAGKKYAKTSAAPVKADSTVPVSMTIHASMNVAIAFRLNRANVPHRTTLFAPGVSRG